MLPFTLGARGTACSFESAVNIVKIESKQKLAHTSGREREVFWTCLTNQKKC